LRRYLCRRDRAGSAAPRGYGTTGVFLFIAAAAMLSVFAVIGGFGPRDRLEAISR